MASEWDLAYVRNQFPALDRQLNGRPVAYFDGPAGSQVPQRVIDAVAGYLTRTNANHGGAFATSRESDALLQEAHCAVADLLGTADPGEVVFGANMTTLTQSLARALSKTWTADDEVIVTRLDHDANVTPWVQAAGDAGASVHHVTICPDDCTLNLDDLREKLNERTRLVAVTAASNAVGTLTPIKEIVELAHQAGAEVFVDAVHYAAHGLIDVADWGCDYLACSAYKFFGPHVGVLWGRRNRLEELPVYKLRPASEELPQRWMTGTQSHEGIAGVLAAVEYLADLGRRQAGDSGLDRRGAIVSAWQAIGEYERKLLERLIRGLIEILNLRLWGIFDPTRLDERVPTIALTHSRHTPRRLAEKLAEQGIFAWDGNFYALPLTIALGVEPDGLLRIGLLHYNTTEEVDRLLAWLSDHEAQ